jgi:hypothetical protein
MVDRLAPESDVTRLERECKLLRRRLLRAHLWLAFAFFVGCGAVLFMSWRMDRHRQNQIGKCNP